MKFLTFFVKIAFKETDAEARTPYTTPDTDNDPVKILKIVSHLGISNIN